MPQCPEPTREAKDVIPFSGNNLIVSIHKTKALAYKEADNKQRNGFTILLITKNNVAASWENAIQGSDNPFAHAPGPVWIVVVQQ